MTFSGSRSVFKRAFIKDCRSAVLAAAAQLQPCKKAVLEKQCQMAQKHTPLQPHVAVVGDEGCHEVQQPHLNPADILPPDQPPDLLDDTALPVSGVMEAFQKALNWQQQQQGEEQEQEEEQEQGGEQEQEQRPPAPGQGQQAASGKQSSNQEPSAASQPTTKAAPQAASNNDPAGARGAS